MVRVFHLVMAFTFGWMSCSSPTTKIDLRYIDFEEQINGGQAHIDVSPSGIIRMSWTRYDSDSTYSLMISTLEGNTWSSTQTIASGTDWFINWADFPAIQSFNDDQHIAAHWLEMSDEGTYDYNIMVSLSADGGKTWSDPSKLHDDAIAAEHGFVSMARYQDKIYVSWLDGRNTVMHDNNHEHRGSMTLRGAFINKSFDITERKELDNRVCDCCQTSTTSNDSTILTAYRNRSSAEIRDISYVIHKNNFWSDPQTVHNDEWLIAGCPVNGPASVMNEDLAGIAWFTMGKDDSKGKIQLAISKDGGVNYLEPIRLDEGDPLGRVDIKLYDQNKFIVTWMEARGTEADIIASIVDEGLNELNRFTISKVSPKRSSGFPRFVVRDDDMIISYNLIEKDDSSIETKVIDITSVL